MWANNGGRNRKAEVWWINGRGYVEGRVGGRPIKRHRYVAEQMLGRTLRPDEDVHHKNGDKTDNRPENLEVLSHGAHSIEHNRSRTYKRGYRLNLTPAQRAERAQRMSAMRRAAIAIAEGR
jgi:hypothetical protein